MPQRSKLFLLGVGFLIPLLILELIFRKYDLSAIRGMIRSYSGERLTDCLIADPELDHRLKENCQGIVKTRDFEVSLKTNSLGFRDRDFEHKADGVKRVLIVGDSFAEGWGVEIENRFDQIESDKYEIINLGTRSYSPLLSQRLLEKHINSLKPDLVISMLDFSDYHDDFYYSEKLGIAVETWPPDERSPLIKALSNSKLFENLYRPIVVNLSNRGQKINRLNITDDISLFGKAADWENYDKGWEFSKTNLEKTKSFLKSRGVEYVVVVVPRGIHISESEWSEGREIIGLEKNKLYNAPKIFEISAIDLLKPLEEAEKTYPGKLYYPFDGHWTSQGHSVVRQAFKDYLDNRYQNNLPKTRQQ